MSNQPLSPEDARSLECGRYLLRLLDEGNDVRIYSAKDKKTWWIALFPHSLSWVCYFGPETPTLERALELTIRDYEEEKKKTTSPGTPDASD